MKLYHGTTVESAKKIMKEGFKYGAKYNWGGKIKSKKGFIYLSRAYAPYYAMAAKSSSRNRALVKVEVDRSKLYPDEDFLYTAGLGTRVQDPNFDLSQYKKYADMSLKHLGNVCAYPKDIKVIGMKEFDARNLIYVCDPTILPINYKFMGKYYIKLTEWIYEGHKPEEFALNYYKKYNPQVYQMMKKKRLT